MVSQTGLHERKSPVKVNVLIQYEVVQHSPLDIEDLSAHVDELMDQLVDVDEVEDATISADLEKGLVEFSAKVVDAEDQLDAARTALAVMRGAILAARGLPRWTPGRGAITASTEELVSA
jgi:hypothetical protein